MIILLYPFDSPFKPETNLETAFTDHQINIVDKSHETSGSCMITAPESNDKLGSPTIW